MHSMATSLFFWFWSVRNETVDSLHHRRLLRDHQSDQKTTTREDIVMMPYLMNLTGDGGEGIGLNVILGPFHLASHGPTRKLDYNKHKENLTSSAI